MSSNVTGRICTNGSSSYEDAKLLVEGLRSMNYDVTQRENNPRFTIEALRRCGITLEDIDKLRVIHITGTKGKGSTSAFCESILRHSGYKTGFFSSPHLIKPNERIRINGQPISDDDFARYVFDIYNKILPVLTEMLERNMASPFLFYTVFAFNVFLKENVDVAVMEVGIGGLHDATNVLRCPTVCAVTSIGVDHVSKLGDTEATVAWYKSGLFKKGVPVLMNDIPPEAEAVLLQRSQEVEAYLYRVSNLREVLAADPAIRLGIPGRIQYVNAGLALHLCKVFTDRTSKPGYQYLYDVWSVPSAKDIPVLPAFDLSTEMITGLAHVSWPGRSQTIRRPPFTYYLDGAHTKESIQECLLWFSEKSKEEAASIQGRVAKVLLFTLSGDRYSSCMLSILKTFKFDEAIFCPSVKRFTFQGNDSVPSTEEDMAESAEFQTTWDSLSGECLNENDVIGDHCVSAVSNGRQPASAASNVANTGVTEVITMDATESNHCGTTKSKGETYATLHNSRSYAFPDYKLAFNWATQDRGTQLSHDANSIMHSIPKRFGDAAHVQILVTGSLYLVGAVLKLLSNDVSQ